VGNGSVGCPSYKKLRNVLSIPSVQIHPHRRPSRHADSHSPYSSLLSGPPGDASFEAEMLARTRHCQLWIFDHTTFALPRGLSAGATLQTGFDSFYAPLDTSDYDKDLDYWDPRQTWQRAHIKPYRIAGFDAHGTGDKPKTYTLESLMQKNGELIMVL
jgi:hypothetical protein